MTTEQHLEKIVEKCRELLAIAEKRTPGKWENSEVNALIYKNEWVIGSMASYEFVDADLPIIPENETFANARYIAACAARAEAGWRATIAAIEALRPMFGKGHEFQQEAREAVYSILAAWPEEPL